MPRAAATRPSMPRIHALRGQPGQIRAAAALRALLEGSAIRDSRTASATRACRIPIRCAASRR